MVLRPLVRPWSDRAVQPPLDHSRTDAPPELVEQLRAYFSAMTATPLRPDDDIFELGLVNSLRALEIVAHIERTFALEVDVDDLELDNFRTAARVAAFVTKKRGAADR